MNIATIMGKIKNVPKITKNEEGKEEVTISVEVERSFKNIDGKYDKDIIECRIKDPEENFKEDTLALLALINNNYWSKNQSKEDLIMNFAVIDKNAPEALRESFLVIDANTGQNGLQQAKVFKNCVNLTAVALTKLDGSAKGAIVLAIAKDLGLPVKLVGVGEKMEDLKPFDSKEFITELFKQS